MKNKLNKTLSLLIFSLAAFGNTVFAQLTLPETKIFAADGRDGAQFGPVKIDGNTMIIGAPGGTIGGNLSQGSAYVYVRSGTNWVLQQKLTAGDGISNDTFGVSIAISGNTIVVGAEFANGARTQQGALYVFVRNANNIWSQQAKLFASDGGTFDRLGRIVRIDGDTIIGGAPAYDRPGPNPQINIGAAYVFVRNGTNWTQQAKLIASDGVGEDLFATSVDVSGDTAVVGAWMDTEGINSFQGSAYIFTRNSAGQWSQQTKILANDGLAGDWFGISSAVEGDTVIVGARQDNLNPGTPGSGNGQGSTYIYTRSGVTWTLQQKIIANGGLPGDAFGESCAILGDSVVVGAVFANVGKGATFLFRRSGTTWTQQQRFAASDGALNDFFGDHVALSRYEVVASAYGDDFGSNLNQGSVYVYSLPHPSNFDFDGDGKSDISVFRSSDRNWYLDRSTGGFAAVQFGLASDKLAPDDYDGDGKTDVAVWRESEGNFYILNSSNNSVRIENFGLPGDKLTVGDWDGDGKADLATYRDGAQSYFYYRGSLNNPSGNITYLPWGTSGDKPMRGDFDGDGKFDVAVFRPSNNIWYIRQSSDGAVRYENWGLSTDKFVPADYDGDAKTDLTVFRNGVWYIKQSSNNQPRYEYFGLTTDTLVPADYDGDGKADVAVFRNGTWYVKQSTSGASITQFGLSGDMPVEAAYLP
jgi:hypothetical protein